MIAALPGRAMDLSAALVVIVVLQTATVLTVVVLAARHGAPRAWPRAAWVCSVGAAGFAAVAVWWVNKPVEGATIALVSSNHGISVGDLLAVPFLVAAIALVAARWWPRKR
jgi:hypothetical protein